MFNYVMCDCGVTFIVCVHPKYVLRFHSVAQVISHSEAVVM